MSRIRLVEEEIANRYSEQQMRCPVHLSIGQESAAVGVILDSLPSNNGCSIAAIAKKVGSRNLLKIKS